MLNPTTKAAKNTSPTIIEDFKMSLPITNASHDTACPTDSARESSVLAHHSIPRQCARFKRLAKRRARRALSREEGLPRVPKPGTKTGCKDSEAARINEDTLIMPQVLSFPGEIVIEGDATQARLFALTEDALSRADAVGVTKGPSVGRTAFWADASCLVGEQDNGDCGVSVVYRPRSMPRENDEWVTEAYQLSERVDCVVAETLAIFMALLAVERRFKDRSAGSDTRTVLIFSDSKDALRCIRDFGLGQGSSCLDGAVVPDEIILKILVKAEEMARRDLRLELRWVPGHKGVTGNMLADKVAKQAAKGQILRSEVTMLRMGKPVGFEMEVMAMTDD